MARTFKEHVRQCDDALAGRDPSFGARCRDCGVGLSESTGFERILLPRGTIRIIAVPAGEAPLEVREKWIGVEIPDASYDPISRGAREVVSGAPVAPQACFCVLQKDALMALAQKSEAAAGWWVKAGFPKHEECFSFRKDEAEIVE